MTKEEFVRNEYMLHKHFLRHIYKPAWRDVYDTAEDVAVFLVGLLAIVTITALLPVAAVIHGVKAFRWKHDRKFVEKMCRKAGYGED